MAIIDNLRMSQEALQSAISKFGTEKMAMENAYLKISNEVRVLDGTWHGSSSEAFKSKFDELYTHVQQNATVMENVISKLGKALETYQEAEQTARNLFESASEGTAYQSVL